MQRITSMLAACAAVVLVACGAQAAGLYFATSGDDLVITAKEADDSAMYWALTISGAGTTTPSGEVGEITTFYDLTGDTGSDSGADLSFDAGFNKYGGLFYVSRGSRESSLSKDGAALTAPDPGTLVDGAASYSFSQQLTFADAGTGTGTFTAAFTINAPTETGTQFTVDTSNTLDANWDSATKFATRSIVMAGVAADDPSYFTADSYNGWQEATKTADQWLELTGTAAAAGQVAEGRTFKVTQVGDLDSGDIGTADNYCGVSPYYRLSGGLPLANYLAYRVSTEQQLSGAWQGQGTPGETYTSSGMLDINIAAAPAGPTVLLGDANNDGVVSADDFAAVQTNFGNTGAADGLLPGDANDDGVVSADDFAAIQTNFGNVLGAAAEAAPVPEPATLSVLALGVLALLRRRKA